MQYNEIELNTEYQYNNEQVVKVMDKTAGWVTIQMLEGTRRNVRATTLEILETNPVILETPKRRVYSKPDGLRMKINGFKYRVRYLDQDEIITDCCMYRATGSRGSWTPTEAAGNIVADHPGREYIEILSKFYNP